MRDDLEQETADLSRSWARHERDWLRDYLVAGVEDPRFNLQSILSRHFLIGHIAGAQFDWCLAQEYKFCATAAWLMRHRTLLGDSETGVAVLHALRQAADNAEGIEIPQFVSDTFSALRIDCRLPHYLERFLCAQASLESTFDTFAELWSRLLRTLRQGSAPAKTSVLEAACGSANDFRFLHRYGIASLIEYTGFDLCVKNIENARALFPNIRFEPGNVFDINAPDKAFDLCLVHDLFEHLSLPGLTQAIKEVCRVTRNGIFVGFFQMDESPEHLVRPVEDYHWNLLSMKRTRQLFEQEGFDAQVIHLDSFLSTHAPGAQTHNPNAYTFLLRAR